MKKIFLMMAAAVSFAAVAEVADEVLVKEAGSNPWRFTIGPVLSPRVRVKVSGPTPVLRAIQPNGSTAAGTYEDNVQPADSSAGYTDRHYADGDVGPDAGTAEGEEHVTWRWNAKDVPSQHVGDRMEFHAEEPYRWTESYASSEYGHDSGGGTEHDLLVGVEAKAGWLYYEGEDFDAGIDAGFRFYGSGFQDANSRFGNTETTTRTDYRFIDSYDASGWEAPYETGAHTGTPVGPNSLIGADPTRRDDDGTVLPSTTEDSHYYSSTRMNYRIWDLRMGPTLGWKPTDYLTIRGGVYGLLGLVDATLKTSVDSSQGAYSSKKTTCRGVFGLAFGLSAELNLTENLFFLSSVEYDWWADKVTLHTGGAEGELRLSDLSITLGLGYKF